MGNIANDVDVDLQLHLKKNLNNLIWRNNIGKEHFIYDLNQDEVVDIYNGLLEGKFTVLYQEQWMPILLERISFVV